MNTLVFSFPEFAYIEKILLALGHAQGFFTSLRFPNKELHTTIQSNVTNTTCIVVGSISPPDSNLLSFLQLCHTLKKEKASHLIALLPYLAYSRQDKEVPRESLSLALLGNMFQAAGVDTVVTVDAHSDALKKLFPIPTHSLSTSSLFAQEIKRLGFQDATIIAPDQGAIYRCQEVSAALGKVDPIVWAEKTRTLHEVSHLHLHGTTKEKVVIIDDILDTGATLLSCCKILKQHKVREIAVMVSHGLFTGKKWKHLFNYGVTSIVCVDTVPTAANYGHTLSVAPLLQNCEELYGNSCSCTRR